MIVAFEVPETAIDAMGLPRDVIALELQSEVAIALYQRGALSVGEAAEMAGQTRSEFEALLSGRRIERPYELAELRRDLDWAAENSEAVVN